MNWIIKQAYKSEFSQKVMRLPKFIRRYIAKRVMAKLWPKMQDNTFNDQDRAAWARAQGIWLRSK